ncbi:MAG TPA: hypothetical protein VME01_03515, partial [Solirubrobacteraceae bacterium]|nr:hypothetical protein [Solirubrobacteraceae bacterium]
MNDRITQLAVGRHLPHRTVRVRLTLLYGALFLLSGAALMAIAYALLVNAGFVFTLQSTELSGSPNTAIRTSPTSVHPASPLSFPAPGSTRPSAQTMAHWRTVAQCIRRHGVSGFPDPTTSFPPKSNPASLGTVSDREGAIFAIPAAVEQSPAFTQATSACGFTPDHTKATAADNGRRTQVRQELLIQSGIALAAMSLLSLLLGWLVAGASCSRWRA